MGDGGERKSLPTASALQGFSVRSLRPRPPRLGVSAGLANAGLQLVERRRQKACSPGAPGPPSCTPVSTPGSLPQPSPGHRPLPGEAAAGRDTTIQAPPPAPRVRHRDDQTPRFSVGRGWGTALGNSVAETDQGRVARSLTGASQSATELSIHETSTYWALTVCWGLGRWWEKDSLLCALLAFVAILQREETQTGDEAVS